jgi:hypothetical protein
MKSNKNKLGKTEKKSGKFNHANAVSEIANRPLEQKKDKVFAITALVCGLMMWVPLFNFILGPLAVIFGVLAIKRVRSEPERYGGQVIAVIGLILGLVSVIFTIIGVYASLFHPEFGILSGINGTILKP